MKLTRRGEIVLAVSLAVNAVLILGAIYWLTGHVWWVGDGYCFDTMTECYFPTEGGR